MQKMMKTSLLENLLSSIRERLPAKTNLANYLSEVLILGRESVYRRLRGEIPFTFDEIVKLSLHMGFSLDNIVGSKKSENALFNIHMLQNSDYYDIYVNKMLEYGRLFREMGNSFDAHARLAVNTMPYFLHIPYKNLSRFRIYKWLYQNQKVKVNENFADFALSEKILQTHETFYADTQKIKDITLIIDDNVFWSAAKDVAYFQKRGLLSVDDSRLLQSELLDMIDRMEQMATTGTSASGASVQLYACAVDLEASYLHFEYGENHFSQVRIFALSAIDSFNEGLCQIQKQWIESLKRYSVLISESGEMQRFEYLNKQREYIHKITDPAIEASA